MSIKWHGGKHYLAKWIVSKFPDNFVHYVEPYFGGGSVLFNLPIGDRSEVVNDLDLDLSVFWRVLRDHGDWFASVVRGIPFSEVEFEQAKAVLDGECDDKARAVAFFVVNRQSRQGLMQDFATLTRNRTRRKMNEQSSSWIGACEELDWFVKRLQGVVILCRNAERVIRTQDSPNTFFYLDPPYLHESRSSVGEYSHEMTTDDHDSLLRLLGRIKGKFALSGYRSEMYEKAAKRFGWRCEKMTIDNKASSSKEKELKTECLWMNY